MNDKEKEAMRAAWENYEYNLGELYSTTFACAFELGLNWHKEQTKEILANPKEIFSDKAIDPEAHF